MICAGRQKEVSKTLKTGHNISSNQFACRLGILFSYTFPVRMFHEVKLQKTLITELSGPAEFEIKTTSFYAVF